MVFKLYIYSLRPTTILKVQVGSVRIVFSYPYPYSYSYSVLIKTNIEETKLWIKIDYWQKIYHHKREKNKQLSFLVLFFYLRISNLSSFVSY